MTQLILALALALGLGAGAASTGADPSLDAAKRLYDDAAYEEALAMLDQLSQADALPREIGVQVQEYRSLCLYALGRTEEADAAMEALVRAAPLFEPSAAELPPRIDELFTGVRRRLLPGLIRERYRAARAAIEQRQFASAQAALTDVQRMIEAAPALGIHD